MPPFFNSSNTRFDYSSQFTCCKEGFEDNLEKLQKAGFPHMQTQGCTCIPSGTSPHADAGGIFPGVQDGEEWNS